MAVIKAVNSKASIGKALDYVTKEEKTEERLISGKDCNPETVKDEMKMTKEQWGKTEGRQYKHYVQSFLPEDKVTPKLAHEIGNKFAQNEKFKGHEVLITTHVDKGHIHNHFIVNSVNFENGKKYNENKKDLLKLKEISNEQSKEHNLTIPTKGDKITTFNQKKYNAFEKDVKGEKESYFLKTCKDVRKTLNVATSKEEFTKIMESKGYELKYWDDRKTKNITFTTPEGKKITDTNIHNTSKLIPKLSKGEMENEFKRNRESRGTESQERGFTDLSSTDKESQGARGTDERNNQDTSGINQGISGARENEWNNEELHRGTPRQGYDNTSNPKERANDNNGNEPKSAKGNDLDFDKAKRHTEMLLRGTSRDIAEWQKGTEGQQSNNLGGNELNRQENSKEHGGSQGPKLPISTGIEERGFEH